MMTEVVGQVQLERWLQEGLAMVDGLEAEAVLCVERAKELQHRAKQIQRALLPQGKRRRQAGCASCGQHRLSKVHKEQCGGEAAP